MNGLGRMANCTARPSDYDSRRKNASIAMTNLPSIRLLPVDDHPTPRAGLANVLGSERDFVVVAEAGMRFVGQVRSSDTSYHWIAKEVQVTGH